MTLLIILTFIMGYAAITLEHSIKINKAATALVTGVICWTIYVLSEPDKHLVTEQLMKHLGEVSGILFFLLGAMTIVELIDANDGFQVITDRIKSSLNQRGAGHIVAALNGGCKELFREFEARWIG